MGLKFSLIGLAFKNPSEANLSPAGRQGRRPSSPLPAGPEKTGVAAADKPPPARRQGASPNPDEKKPEGPSEKRSRRVLSSLQKPF
jgi:hypothetical protein